MNDPMTTTEERAVAQRKIANRLKRAHGQLAAVIAAVESDAECRDVVIQLAAVSKALDRAGYAIISSAMRTCLVEPDGTDDAHESLTVDELEKLFLTLS